MLGGILSIVQSLVHVAASSDDPAAMQRKVDGILAGRNADANRIAGELGVRAPVSLRVNPDVDAHTHAKITTGKSDNKFGIPAIPTTTYVEGTWHDGRTCPMPAARTALRRA